MSILITISKKLNKMFKITQTVLFFILDAGKIERNSCFIIAMLFTLNDDMISVGSDLMTSLEIVKLLQPSKFIKLAGCPKIIFLLDPVISSVNIFYLFLYTFCFLNHKNLINK
jgi:hypothetical protein